MSRWQIARLLAGAIVRAIWAAILDPQGAWREAVAGAREGYSMGRAGYRMGLEFEPGGVVRVTGSKRVGTLVRDSQNPSGWRWLDGPPDA